MYISIQLTDGEYYNMTSLSTLFGGGESSGVDPLQEGYPVIAVYGGSFNQYFDIRLHRVHSGELVGSPWGSMTNSTASYASGQQNMHEFGYSSDRGNLDSSYSSQNYNSHSSYVMSMMQHDHYPYSFYGSCSKDGRMGMHSFHGSDYYEKYYRRINVISLPGRRPRRQFNISNTQFSETQFNSSYGIKNTVNLSDNSNEFFAGSAPGNTTNYGSGCYNQRTKTLALYYANSAGAADGRMYMYRGTKDLMSETECPTVKDFFDNCTIVYQNINNGTNWGFSSISYNVNMVLGDNDFVGMNARNSSTNVYKSFDCSTTVSNTSQISTYSSQRSEGNTTSYGPEQGMMHRARMQLTWDTDWAAMHSPYYYYGCGSSTYIVSVKDPRRMVYYSWSANNYGGIFTPSGKTGFKVLYGENTDSSPIRNWGIELSQTSHDPTASFQYFSGDQNYGAGIRTINNWTGTVSNSMAAYSFQYPGYYYSTSYPKFMTVNWWQQEGAYSQ